MPLDPSIIMGGQAPQIQNPLDVQNKALTMRHLAQQGQMQDQAMADDQANRAAARNNMNIGPDGVPTLNRAGYLSQLGQTAPTLAMQKAPEMAQQDAATKEAQLKLQDAQRGAIKNLIFSATPETWTQMYQQYAKSGLPGIENITPQFPGVDAANAIKMHILTADEQIKQQNSDRDYQAKRDDHSDRLAAMQIQRDTLGATKQNQSMQQVQQTLESARGNPAAAQAEKDIYAGQKLNSLINLNGDPNKLNPQEVQLAATEIAKIASGGVPSSHELQGLTPSTISSKFASLAQQVTNNPQSANAGEFLKEYQKYADSLTKDAKQVIEDKYGRVIESRKSQLGPQNYQALKGQYLDRFNPKTPAAADHPQDAAAMDWAKANPNDPRAAQILKLNGGGQ